MNGRSALALGFLVALVTAAHGGEIHEAADKGDLRRVEALLAADASLINQEGNDYTTPLHWASASGHKAVVELLNLQKGGS